MSHVQEEDTYIKEFRSWFTDNGGKMHENMAFSSDNTGYSVKAREEISPGTVIASCPFSLAITVETCHTPLEQYLHVNKEKQGSFSERQLICAYIALHWIISSEDDESQLLKHRPYINVLPKPEALRTPLYFTEFELNMFQGTNMFGAVKDQRESWQKEYKALRDAIHESSPNVFEKFSWDMYCAAATYLSSRAFPSSLLSVTPSLVASPSSYPVLLPGVDSLNHKRGHPVVWNVSRSEKIPTTNIQDALEDNLNIEISSEFPYSKGEEILNNYGPKPNSSLILGYGFALPDNPDDTILLKIGSSSMPSSDLASEHQKQADCGIEIGRNASGADKVWEIVKQAVFQNYEVDESIGQEDLEALNLQIDMETAETLTDMVVNLHSKVPSTLNASKPVDVRDDVYTMWLVYTQGQADILDTFLQWTREQNRAAVRRAEGLGVILLGEDEEEV